MSKATKSFKTWLNRLFSAPDRMSVSDWIVANIVLPPSGQEAEPGKMSFKKAPFLKGMLDDTADPRWQTFAVMGPVRSGKTLWLRLLLMFCIAKRPQPVGWYDSTIESARDISRHEIQPMMAWNSVINSLRPKDKNKFSLLRMMFPGANITLAGGNSPHSARGKTIDTVIGNECNAWSFGDGKEAAIIELVMNRTIKAGARRRHYFSSTPSGHGQIFALYNKGDQCQWHVKCEKCQHQQPLEWESVIWDKAHRDPISKKWNLTAAGESARYVCKSCSHPHDQDALDRMKLSGDWLPTAIPEDPTIRSYHISGLALMMDTSSMAAGTRKWLSAKRSGAIKDRMDFYYSWLGWPWKTTIETLSLDKLNHLSAPYARGTVPAGVVPWITLLSYDVQSRFFWYVVRVFSITGESWLVDHGRAENFEDLSAIESTYKCNMVIGDGNFAGIGGERRKSQLVYTLNQRRAKKKWFIADGVEYSKKRLDMKPLDVYAGTKLGGTEAIQCLTISSYDFKLELESKLSGTIKNWHVYSVDETDLKAVQDKADYFAQLLSEFKEPRGVKLAGKPDYVFTCNNGNNHYWDCEYTALAFIEQQIDYRVRAADLIREKQARRLAQPEPTFRVAGTMG